jgi:hypothetical protein
MITATINVLTQGNKNFINTAVDASKQLLDRECKEARSLRLTGSRKVKFFSSAVENIHNCSINTEGCSRSIEQMLFVYR